MSDNTVATLAVSFEGADGTDSSAANGNDKIVLEQMTTSFNASGQLLARCFPSTGVRFAVSQGSLEPLGSKTWTFHQGVRFSDADSAELDKPYASEVQFIGNHIFMTRDKDGYLVRSTATPSFDEETNSIIVTNRGHRQKVYGGVLVSYKATYLVLGYRPLVLAQLDLSGFAINLGTIFAYTDKDVATLDMELDVTQEQDWVEYARVYSKIVLDPDGAWELPDNWRSGGNTQTTGEYSTGTHKIDPDNCFVDERLHCIVSVNYLSQLRYDFVGGGLTSSSWLQPYFGSDAYWPEMLLRRASAPTDDYKNRTTNLFKDGWHHAFLKVNYSSMLSYLQGIYGSLITG